MTTNPTPISADDPRLTAFALGERETLSPADLAQIESAAASDPTLAAEVEAIRATARDARALLGTSSPGLAPSQRAAILSEAAKPARNVVRRWAPFGVGFAAAAVLVVLGLRGGPSPERDDEESRMNSGTITMGRPLQDEAFFGTPANPQGAGAGAHPEPNAQGTSQSSGLYYADGWGMAGVPSAGSPHGRLSVRRTSDSVRVGPGRGAVGTFYSSTAQPVTRISPSSSGGGHATSSFFNASQFSGGGGSGPAATPVTVTGGGGGAGGGFVDFTSSANVHINGRLALADADSVVEGYQGPQWKVIEASGAVVPDVQIVRDANGRTLAISTRGYAEPSTGEDYARAVEQAFLRAVDSPLSTFSIDVDTASYSNIRRMLTDGQRPPADAVRVEELLNYFRYQYEPPAAGGDPFAVRLEVTACPWNLKHRLVRVGLKGREIERKARPPMNLVFLLDVSGSMDAPNKLPLVQASMRMLLEELNERDSVAIVTYAGESGLVLPPTWCEQKAVIQKAIDDLRAGGSTNGASGIALAYQTAALRFNKDSINRVVLATDGDFNVGATSHEELLALITEKAKSGVFLTALGYGMGNLKDATLELLADKGNGAYGYIDSTKEAHKVLVEDASGTLVTIAKDVKIQVEFNPATVGSYRLVGYDNRRLAAQDFADDTKDAGEIGAGHTVTALYEVVPVGADDKPAAKPEEEPLRYGPQPVPRPVEVSGVPIDPVARELMTVKLRWKEPTGTSSGVSVKKEFPLTDAGTDYAKATVDTKFAASVAAFAMLLKGSPYAGNASLDGVLEWAGEGLSFDPGGYRKEFVELVAKAKTIGVK